MEPQREYTKAEKHAVLIAACTAIFINPMVGGMLNLALSAIGSDLDCSTHQLGWLSSVYFIASVVALMPAARLSDIYGKKLIFTVGLVIASAGLVLSTFSWDIWALYVFRSVTGIGMAMISCNGVAMISDVYRKNERGMALSLNTACVYIGASIGPTLGGVLTDMVGWRLLFIVILIFPLVSMISILRFRYNIRTSPDSPFDGRGAAVYVVGIVVTMLGVLNLPQLFAFAMIGIGLAIMVGFVFLELRTERPIVQMRIFRNSRFSRSLVALFLNYAASFSISFFLSLYFQEVGAMTATEAGLVLMVQPVFQVIVTLAVGRFIESLDYRILPTLGMAVLCLGLILMLFLGTEIDLPYAILCLVINGVGFGLFSSPNTTATMSYVHPSEYGEASGLIAALRQAGMMISMGVATCLIAVFMGSTSHLTPENYGTFVDVMRYAWGICIAFCAVGMVFSWFRGKTPSE